MQFTYKVKKRYPFNKNDNDWYCEVRTRAPGANILIVVNSWLPNFKFSMNGPAQLTINNLKEIEESVHVAVSKIKDAQNGVT